MPRGVRRERNFAEEIGLINARIADYEAKIKTLRTQLDFISKERDQQELRNLNKMLAESGLTIDEVAKIIKKPKNEIA